MRFLNEQTSVGGLNHIGLAILYSKRGPGGAGAIWLQSHES